MPLHNPYGARTGGLLQALRRAWFARSLFAAYAKDLLPYAGKLATHRTFLHQTKGPGRHGAEKGIHFPGNKMRESDPSSKLGE